MAEEPKQTEVYRKKMDELLVRHGLNASSLELVIELPEAERGHSPVAMCYKIRRKILMKKTFTEADKETVVAILHRFDEKEVATLKDDWNFIKHTLLHEICHILNRYKDDYECDKWAFYEARF